MGIGYQLNIVLRSDSMSERLEERNIPVDVDRMIKWFSYDHLPEHLQLTSKLFHTLCMWICDNIERGPQRTRALQHLLIARDDTVRATLYPGG